LRIRANSVGRVCRRCFLISPYEEAKKKLLVRELTDVLLAEAVSAYSTSNDVQCQLKKTYKTIGYDIYSSKAILYCLLKSGYYLIVELIVRIRWHANSNDFPHSK
jgi:hypothetical protein